MAATGSIIRVDGQAMRVLGQVRGEVAVERLASRQLSSIPSSVARGAKVVSKLSRSRARRESVRARVNASAPLLSVQTDPVKKKRRAGENTLYLLRVADGTYKVGRSHDVKRRVASLQTSLFDKVLLVRAWKQKEAAVLAMERDVKRGIRHRGGAGGTEVFKAPSDRAAISFVCRHTQTTEPSIGT